MKGPKAMGDPPRSQPPTWGMKVMTIRRQECSSQAVNQLAFTPPLQSPRLPLALRIVVHSMRPWPAWVCPAHVRCPPRPPVPAGAAPRALPVPLCMLFPRLEQSHCASSPHPLRPPPHPPRRTFLLLVLSFKVTSSAHVCPSVARHTSGRRLGLSSCALLSSPCPA